MTRGDKIIAISEFIAGHIRQIYGVPTDKICLIHRGVDLANFNPTGISEQRIIKLSQKWRLPDGVPVIMFPGRLTRWKGQKSFITAIKHIKRRDFVCLMVGSDQGRLKYRKELEKTIEELELGSVIRVLDHCDDMPAAYMLSDIVVSTSIEPEAFGRVAAEAQAMGRIVIASDHGGAKETVTHGHTGWLTPPDNPRALATTLETVLSQNSSERAIFSENAIKHVSKNFSRELMCKQTLDVYNSLLPPEYTDKLHSEIS